MQLRYVLFAFLLLFATLLTAQMDIQLRHTNGTFDLWLMPKADYSGLITDVKFTISWDANYNVDLGASGTETLYVLELNLVVSGNATQTTITNGTKKYRHYSLSVGGNKAFTNNVPLKIMTVPFSGQGNATLGQFGIDNDAFTTANNLDYYFELDGGTDITGATSSIATSVVLPLELLDFKAVEEDKSVVLNWKTTHERNVAHFDVEKNTDATTAKNWLVVAHKQAQNAQNTEGSYFSTDVDAFNQSNTLLYRLKMVNTDGSFNYSKAITVQRAGNFKRLKLYPNPVRNVLQLIIESDKSAPQTVRIVDIVGKVWQQTTVNLSKGVNQQTFDVQALPSGVYCLQTTDGKGLNQTLKWVKL